MYNNYISFYLEKSEKAIISDKNLRMRKEI